MLVHHEGFDTREAHGDFHPDNYVSVPMLATHLGPDWEIEVDERRARVMPESGAGSHHVDDIVLRARRLR